jgi:glycosyltransferase involved in cell wall biosynthesis
MSETQVAPAATVRGSAPRILALHWFDACSPWRIGIPMRALARLGYEVRQAPINAPAALDDVDVLVLHRPTRRQHLELLREARRLGIATVVDVDDLFLPGLLPRGAPFARVWHPLFKRWEAEDRAAAGVGSREEIDQAPLNNVMEQFHDCLRSADAVTVTTAALADAYAQFSSAVYVVPNAYDDSDPLWDDLPTKRPTVNVGFAGTDHHDDNLALLGGALEPVLRAHPDARIVEAGGPALLRRVNAPAAQLVHLGTLPFDLFPLLLREMDVVLAPLADEPFMRCKSNIRCMTAGLVGVPVVASPVGPYAEYVEHGANGFLARSSEDWTRYVDLLVADNELRSRMGRANRARAEAHALSRELLQWVNVYDGLLRDRRRA